MPKTHRLSAWLFVRLMALVYFAAFASLLPQICALIGVSGISPLTERLPLFDPANCLVTIWQIPSLFLFFQSDAALLAVCALGSIFALLVLFDVLSGPLLFVLYFLYLSIVCVGGEFLAFQWDTLLLETGFLTIFLGHCQLRGKLPWRQNFVDEPSVLVIWLLRFLCFKLMFMSGCVKLLSGDGSWPQLTAMAYHYETQPLPVPLSWALFYLPLWWHKLETLACLVIELFVPWFIFGPRNLRLLAALLLGLLQILILISGNFAFFNWLGLGLCLILCDDQALLSTLPRSIKVFLRGNLSSVSQSRRFNLRSSLAGFLAFVIIGPVSFFSFLRPFAPRELTPQLVLDELRILEPFCIVNRYGLFAVMTRSRPEIIVEGSDDGLVWKEYGFKFKPGDLRRAPPMVAPFQPRLDWQMWFAALGDPGTSPWFLRFMLRLLQGEKAVLELLDYNPFPKHPPRFLKASLYLYRFSGPKDLALNGQWWSRTYLREYMPAISLQE